jgi:excisionase family DNA binding protein
MNGYSRWTSELATHLGVSARTVRRWCKDGLIQAIKTPGGHWRISDRYPFVPKEHRQAEKFYVPKKQGPGATLHIVPHSRRQENLQHATASHQGETPPQGQNPDLEGGFATPARDDRRIRTGSSF